MVTIMTTGSPSNPASSPATSFAALLRASTRRRQSLLCVGLDPLPERLPAGVGRGAEGAAAFCAAVVDATLDLASAYKLNLGFYLAFGQAGIDALARVRAAIPADVPAILDCKVGDVDSTAAAYARGWFDEFGFDALTVNPYLGEDSLAPFLSYADRGVFVLCKTSNAGSGDFQDLAVRSPTGDEATLFETVARRTAEWQRRYPATVGLVVGATYSDQLARIRSICPTQPILLPGIGAQRGDLEAAVRAGVDSDGEGLLASASRSIIYASNGADFTDAARKSALAARDAINRARAAMTAPAAP
jgi:orotidine-5'-phosphate decarboxylase